MTNKRLVLAGLVLLVGVAGASTHALLANNNQHGGVEWHGDYAEAQQEAQAENEPLLIYFSGKHCKYCEEFQKEMSKQDVEGELRQYARVKVMWSNSAELRAQYLSSGDGTPTVVVATTDGEVVSKYNPVEHFDSLPQKFQQDYEQWQQKR